MDVRCGLCGTEYDFDDALISERGTTVQCTECGFQFKVYPEQPLSGRERWIVRSGSGAGWEREYTSLKDLQQAIRQGDVGPADLLSRGASEARPLASIAELEPLFRQRMVRSGGTLLGMMPGPAALSPEVTPTGRRVATKLGLPTPPAPERAEGAAPPGAVPPPPVEPAPEEQPPGERPPLARTLPSAITPSSVADLGAERERASSAGGPMDAAAGPLRHPSAPRQRIVSLLSASEEDQQPAREDERAWATQTLPSTPDGPVMRPREETNGAVEEARPEPRQPGTPAASPAGPPALAQESEEPEIVLPARRGGGRWAVGALALAAAAAALWGWSRVGESTLEPEVAEPTVAAAETVPAEPAPQDVPASAEHVADEGDGDEGPRPATSAPPKVAPEAAPRTPTKDAVDYRTRLGAASRAVQGGDTARAQGLYEAVLREQPGNVEALAGLAEVAQRRGETQKSAQLYDQVLASNPSYAPALIGRGDQLWAAGDRAGAVQLYRRVVEQLGTTGTYGKRAQSRIDEARARPPTEAVVAEEGATEKGAAAGDAQPGPPRPSTEEASDNPTSNAVDDTESDE